MEQAQQRRCPAPMDLLHRGVPLSLLLDLVFGPDSEHVLRTELPRPRRPAAVRAMPGRPDRAMASGAGCDDAPGDDAIAPFRRT